MTLTMIVDSNDSYLTFQKNKWLEENHYVSYDKSSDFSTLGQDSFFNDPQPVIVHVQTVEQVKTLVSQLKEFLQNGEAPEVFTQGALIVSQMNRNSTKTLEKAVKECGGTVLSAKENSKEKPEETLKKILSEVNFSHEVNNFLTLYAGDEYSKVIPFIQAVSVLSPEQQNKLTIEHVVMRLPYPQGSIPPWSVEKPLMSGNKSSLVHTLRRVLLTSHPLLVVALLTKKFLLAHSIAGILSAQPSLTEKDVATLLNQTCNYPFKLAYTTAKNVGQKRLMEVLLELNSATESIKGDNPFDPKEVVEMSLLKISSLLKA